MKVDYQKITQKYVTKEEMEEIVNKGILDETLEIIDPQDPNKKDKSSLNYDGALSKHSNK